MARRQPFKNSGKVKRKRPLPEVSPGRAGTSAYCLARGTDQLFRPHQSLDSEEVQCAVELAQAILRALATGCVTLSLFSCRSRPKLCAGAPLE